MLGLHHELHVNPAVYAALAGADAWLVTVAKVAPFEPAVAAGEMLLTPSGGRIGRLVVTFDRGVEWA